MNDLDYLRLSKPRKLLHNLGKLLCSLPKRLWHMLVGIAMFFWNIIKGAGNTVKDVVMTYIRGDWKTKVSYTVMGFGSCARGQWLRGILFFVFQTLFNLYLFVPFLKISGTSRASGLGMVSKLPTLGTQSSTKINNVTVYGDNSFLILLYGVLTLFFIVAFLYTWYVNIKQNRISEEILRSGKPLKSAKDDVHSLLDNQFHKTLLALPTAGVVIFTILPIIFMVLIAFTNYDSAHQPPEMRFEWVGLDNFKSLLPETADEKAIVISNISDHPAKDGRKILDITAKNGDQFSMTIPAADAHLTDAAQEAVKQPPTAFPLELKPGDGFTLEAGRATRSNATPVLTLANGNVLSLTCKPAGHKDLTALVDKAGKEGLSVSINWDGSAGTLKVTAKDGASVEMTITKVTERLAKDIRAEMTFVYLEEQPLAMTSALPLTFMKADGTSADATVPVDQIANVAKALELLNAGGVMRVEKKTAEVVDEEGNVTASEISYDLYITPKAEAEETAEAAVEEVLVVTGIKCVGGEIDEAPEAMKCDLENDQIDLTINNTDGKTILAKAGIAEAANIIKAEKMIAEGGSLGVEKVIVETKGGKETQFSLYVEGVDEELLTIKDLKGRETYNGTLTLQRADGFTITLNAEQIIVPATPSMSDTFKQVLLWTLIWAFFATFLNYFLGMLVAIMINKKGIRFKKLWRTVLVMTIAIPQFISLLYVSKMFASDGLINATLMNWGWISKPLPFWTNATWAKITIIVINVWIGIPYLMLIATGILMNIPADLYESARIDGANAFQTYMKITLPYMLFVTGPYLLTSFTGNINNFNVIFLLSQGKPTSMELMANAGNTDLLITWLYKMTVNDSNYKLAAVMGILVFVVCAVINLIVYNMIPSVKNEEDFQ